MSSHARGMYGPFWSGEANQHYWYDSANDLLIYQDGNTYRRPPNVPRAELMPPRVEPTYSASPPGDTAAYTTSGPAPFRQTTQPSSSRAAPGPSEINNLTRTFGSMAVGASATANDRSQQDQPSLAAARRQPTRVVVGGTTTELSDIQVATFNANNRVRTVYRTGPVDAITDPELLRSGTGRGAYRMLLATGNEGETEALFSTFEISRTPRRFFVLGRVFMVLWSEPAGSTLVTAGVTARAPGTTKGRYGETVFSKVRRFVVIREGTTYCSALPIMTYGAQGVGKANITKSEHAIIYTGRNAPAPMSTEEPVRGEQGMRPDSIRVEPDDREDKLDPRSRIDFGKVHTIQHNIKVKSYGKVSKGSMQALVQQFNSCWLSSSVATVTPSAGQIPGPSRVQEQTLRARGTGSSGQRSLPRGSASGGSATGEQVDVSERQRMARLREHRRQQYWAAVQVLMRDRNVSEEEAREAINARLEQRRSAGGGQDEDDDDNNNTAHS